MNRRSMILGSLAGLVCSRLPNAPTLPHCYDRLYELLGKLKDKEIVILVLATDIDDAVCSDSTVRCSTAFARRVKSWDRNGKPSDDISIEVVDGDGTAFQKFVNEHGLTVVEIAII